MKKNLYFAALAALAMTSCSTETDLNLTQVKEEAQIPVNFSTYMGGGVTSRAGETTTIKNVDDLKTTQGFGVFAYYTGASTYNSSIKPNFMYNQQVHWGTNTATGSTTEEWYYNPIKFWPNDYNTADNQTPAAQGTKANQYMSFFAYAPYVANSNAGTGAVSGSTASGITAMSGNTVEGNPFVQYTLSTDGNDVDLLWGTAGENGKYINDAADANSNTGISSAVLKTGSTTDYVKVNGDLQKMTTGGKVKFSFKHALAKVGGPDDTTTADKIEGLSIVLDPDEWETTQTTKVLVKSIKIVTSASKTTGTGASAVTTYYKGGQFDLKTGEWTYPAGMQSSAAVENTTNLVTSPASGSTDQQLNENIAEPTTAPVKTADAWTALKEGVTKTAKAVYQSQDAKAVLFIPGTTPSLKVEITYIVRTKDAQLADAYSEIEQTISRTVDFTQPVQLNKMYNLLIKLGLTSVKFEATVENWEKTNSTTDTNNDGVSDDTEVVNLPLNVTE